MRQLLLVVLTLVVTACTHMPARVKVDDKDLQTIPTSIDLLVKDEEHRRQVARSSFEDHDDFVLGFVEFDDQGWMWNEEQFRLVKREFERRLLHDEKGNDAVRPAIIVAFVHGWRHSPQVCDRDVVCFREVLRGLAFYEKARAAACPPELREAHDPRCVQRQIAGIMLGWKGAPIGPQAGPVFEKLNVLSFYSRKNSAHRIGSAGYVASVIGWLRTIDRQLDAAAPNTAPEQSQRNSRSRLVMAGHSFGAAVLYSAISGVVNEEVAEGIFDPRRPEADDCRTFDVNGIGDMVVLINPAFEALRYDSVHNRTRDLRNCESRRNLLVTISAKNDVYNRFWFTFGRRFSAIWDTFTRNTSQREASIRALGHYEPFHTHTLTKNDSPKMAGLFPEPQKTKRDCGCKYAANEGQMKLLADAVWHKYPASGADPLGIAAPAENDCDTPSCLTAEGKCDPNNPFKVIWTDDGIVDGHSDIYNPRLLDFLVRSVATSDVDR